MAEREELAARLAARCQVGAGDRRGARAEAVTARAEATAEGAAELAAARAGEVARLAGQVDDLRADAAGPGHVRSSGVRAGSPRRQ